jgi:DNA-directed RNA polymerase subunit beta'
MGHIELSAPVAHVWYTRRIPSYLGLLLDISRRNLDRVLYFAQYVVTYVDEDARQKALKRLEDKIAGTEREQAGRVNTKIAEAKADRDRKLSEMQQRKAEIEERYNETVAEKLEPIIKEGQRLDALLQEQVGKSARTEARFLETGELLAEAGETISNQHLAKVQQIVKAHLEDVERELKDQKARDIEHVKLDVERLRADADLAMNWKIHSRWRAMRAHTCATSCWSCAR